MQDVGSAATALAGEGYFISAMGGNDIDGYVLVGMRVQGDTIPRPLVLTVGGSTSPASNPDNAYYSEVVHLETTGGFVVAGEQ